MKKYTKAIKQIQEDISYNDYGPIRELLSSVPEEVLERYIYSHVK